MKLKMLYAYLNSDLDAIEKELYQTIQARHPLLREASEHLLSAGGKRIRPAFVLLAGKFGNYDIETMKKVAVSLELIHMASLVHDDVVDDAELRRGQLTIKSKWDNRIAMYTGDYIFARSLEMMTELNKPEAHQILSKTIVEVCIGEIEQIRDQYNWDQDLRNYLRRIKRKTALLIAVSCELGAVAAGVSKQEQRLLYQYGYNVGMAFQITDDILDFTGTEKELGKPAGGDLKQGNITLPALYARQDDSIRSELLKVGPDPASYDLEHVLSLIRSSGGIEYSREISDRYLSKAYEALQLLPDNRANQTLKKIAEFIGKRKY